MKGLCVFVFVLYYIVIVTADTGYPTSRRDYFGVRRNYEVGSDSARFDMISRRYVSPSLACATPSDVMIRKRYFDGCNWCRCRDIGSSACTRRGCKIKHQRMPRTVNYRSASSKRKHRHRANQYIPPHDACLNLEDVAERKRYFDGCNWCRCKDIGESRCNTRVCHLVTADREGVEPEDDGVKYIPPQQACRMDSDIEKHYFDGCNHCKCLFVGGATCTRMPCPAKQRYEAARRPTTKRQILSNNENSRLQHALENGESQPRSSPAAEKCASPSDSGKRYYDGCNWCRCYGIKTAICTLRDCPWRVEPIY